MGTVRLLLGLFPTGFWRTGLRLEGLPEARRRPWYAAELARGDSLDIA